MTWESILIAAIIAAVAYPLFAIGSGGRWRAAVAAALLFTVSVPVVTAARRYLRAPSAIDPEVLDRPVVEPQGEYVSSDACRSCHPEPYASWSASYHHTMTREAVPGAAAGDFGGVTLRAGEHRYTLERRGDEFWVRTEAPDAGTGPVRSEQPVVLVTGSHHYQVYWLPDEKKGVLRAFPFVYLFDEQKWIPRKAAFLSPPEPNRTVESARWNNGCAKCHSLHARWRPVRPKTDTRVAELGISCEACHGPAEAHVTRYQTPTARYAQHFGSTPDETIVQPERLDSRRASEVCGQCHAISLFVDRDDFSNWASHGYRYRPGDVLEDTRDIVRGLPEQNSAGMLERLETKQGFLEDSFWEDGTVRVAGREYNGLLETPCYQRGELSCLSCHEMHRDSDDPRSLAEWANGQLAPGMRGNQACVQCHSQWVDAEALAKHTRHAPDSSGSECQNCHMPYTVYGLLKAIRSHTIDSPVVRSPRESTRPNACNQCHLDQTLEWSARHLNDWFSVPEPVLDEEERNVAASLLWILEGHAGQRALAAWTMGWGPALEISGGDWMAPYLAQLLVDPYDAVRFVAYRSLKRQPGFADFAYDSLADRAERAQISQRAFARWRQTRSGENRSTGAKLMLDEQGEIQIEATRKRLARRDDRLVNFRE